MDKILCPILRVIFGSVNQSPSLLLLFETLVLLNILIFEVQERDFIIFEKHC